MFLRKYSKFATLGLAAVATMSISVGTANADDADRVPSSAEYVDATGADAIVSEGNILGSLDSVASQSVLLYNGVTALITVSAPDDSITVDADNGESHQFSLSALRAHVQNETASEERSVVSNKMKKLKKPNSCQVATGLAGIGHSALWGAALGGPAGAAAGALVGGFWWGVSTQC